MIAGVDVAIPSYQYGRFLRQCVISVLSQGIRDVRILIIDNASTDNSLEVAQQLAAEDRRVEVVAHQRNVGPHASFNEAIDWASSKYFMVLCADDLLAPESLARTVSIMDRHPDVSFAYGRTAALRPGEPIPDLDPRPRDTSWRILAGGALLEQFCRTGVCHIPGPSAVVVRTATLKLAGYHRPDLEHSDDFEMWMRLACRGSVAETRAKLAILRIHGSNRSAFAGRVPPRDLVDHERDRSFYIWHDEAAFESFFAHEGGSLPEAARLHRLAKRSLGERAYWSALAHLCRCQPSASRHLLKFALRLAPVSAILPPVSYLFRRDDLAKRITSVASEMVRRWHDPARLARMRG